MKLSVTDIRNIKVGQSCTFNLDDAAACRNGQILALRDSRVHGYTVTTRVDYDNAKLVISRIA